MLYFMGICHHSASFPWLVLLQWLCCSDNAAQNHFLTTYLKLVTELGEDTSYPCRPTLNDKFIIVGHCHNDEKLICCSLQCRRSVQTSSLLS